MVCSFFVSNGVHMLAVLRCCAMNGWVPTSKRLLAARAEVLLSDASGSSALHYGVIHQEATGLVRSPVGQKKHGTAMMAG